MGKPDNLLCLQLNNLQLQVAQLVAARVAPALSYNVILYNATPGRCLNSTNYSNRAHQLQSSLVGRGLLQLVLNAKPKPTDTTPADIAQCQQWLNIAYAMITTQLNPTV